jgi:hypothetical protein
LPNKEYSKYSVIGVAEECYKAFSQRVSVNSHQKMLIVLAVKPVNKVNKYSGFCSYRYSRFVPKCQFYSNIAETYMYQEFQAILPLVTASLYLRPDGNTALLKQMGLVLLDAVAIAET